MGKLEQLPERQRSKLMLYKAVCLMETKQYKQTVLILNAVLNKLEPQHTKLLQADDKKSLLNLLIQAYSCRGKANERLENFQKAYKDFDRLIELCQFQNLPTEKIFEYMSVRAALKSKIITQPKSDI